MYMVVNYLYNVLILSKHWYLLKNQCFSTHRFFLPLISDHVQMRTIALLVPTLFVAIALAAPLSRVSVYRQSGTSDTLQVFPKLVQGFPTEWAKDELARATFHDTYDQKGWRSVYTLGCAHTNPTSDRTLLAFGTLVILQLVPFRTIYNYSTAICMLHPTRILRSKISTQVMLLAMQNRISQVSLNFIYFIFFVHSYLSTDCYTQPVLQFIRCFSFAILIYFSPPPQSSALNNMRRTPVSRTSI